MKTKIKIIGGIAGLETNELRQHLLESEKDEFLCATFFNYLTTKTETMKLISMTDFVLEHSITHPTTMSISNENISKIESHNTILEYAKFLKQPLKLEMFVAVDKKGNMLEEPIPENYFNTKIPINELSESDSEGLDRYHVDLLIFEYAREKVLFEGFEYVKFINDGELLPYHRLIKNDEYFNVRFLDRNIEDLLTEFEYGIELTPTAIKQIQP